MKLKEIHIRLVGIPILALIMAIVFRAKDNDPFYEKYLTSLMYTAFYWNGACYMFFYFRRRIPAIRDTPKRLLLTSLSLLTMLLVGDFFICIFVRGDITSAAEYNVARAVPTLLAGLFVGLLYEAVYFFEQWKNTVRINEALKNQQIRTQFEVLQNQMSPHFLFNSLNALTALIAEDQDVAMSFTQKLSEVYRYILQNKEKDLVTLEKELEFTRAYLYLLQMRYPENLKANFSVADDYMDRYVAPLTIQILVENAVKHNVISRAQPLQIDIYVENEDVIIVKNNLQVKNVIEKSTKTGLDNIKKRYEFFGDRPVNIINTAQNFLVSIPLISLIHKEDRTLSKV